MAFALEIRGLLRGNRGFFPKKLLHIGNRIFSDFFRVGSGVPMFRSDPCAALLDGQSVGLPSKLPAAFPFTLRNGNAGERPGEDLRVVHNLDDRQNLET